MQDKPLLPDLFSHAFRTYSRSPSLMLPALLLLVLLTLLGRGTRLLASAILTNQMQIVLLAAHTVISVLLISLFLSSLIILAKYQIIGKKKTTFISELKYSFPRNLVNIFIILIFSMAVFFISLFAGRAISTYNQEVSVIAFTILLIIGLFGGIAFLIFINFFTVINHSSIKTAYSLAVSW